MKKQTYLTLFIVICLFLLPVLSRLLVLPANAQTVTNLVANGDFEDADLSVWTMGSYGVLSRTTGEVYAGSYSGQLVLEDTFEGSYDGNIYQCIDLSGVLPTWPTHSDGYKYLTAAGWFNRYIESWAQVRILLQFWETTTCNTFISGGTSTGVAIPNWTQDTITMQIPATAQSLRLWVSATSPDVGPVYIDNVEIFSSTPTAVSLQHLGVRSSNRGVEVIMAVLIVASVALVLKRRRSSRF